MQNPLVTNYFSVHVNWEIAMSIMESTSVAMEK